MKIRKIFFLGCLLTNINTFAQTKLFDDNWRFLKEKDSIAGAEQPGFPDASWRKVHLPHDWAIEDLPNQNDSTIIGPFNKYSPATEQGGYVMGGTAWYRKTFTLKKQEETRIRFDGVYMDSDVWLNGHHLGNHPYGYTPFTYDLTPYLAPAGKANVLAVRIRNAGINTRWYSGAGIYRHVYLISTPKIHLGEIFVTTPVVTREKATIQIAEASNAAIKVRIIDSTGKVVAEGKQTTLNNPIRWSPAHPYLYKAEISLINAGKVADQTIISFGIRNVHIDAETGLTINGERTLLKGGCVHHDNGLLGAAAFDRAEERKVELLKAAGFNAIRTSHNPPSEKFLETCDRLGMLVIDEAFDMWLNKKNPQDYHRFFHDWWQRDLKSMVLRDRNHPSVIMWSIGNEIPERADSLGLVITRQLVNEIKKLDTTRPITEAENNFWERPYKWEATDKSFALLDAAGYNYMWNRYAIDQKRVPGRIVFGSETVPSELYQAWTQVQGLPYVIGDFVWTAMDYLGEAGLGHSIYATKESQRLTFPWFNAYCGDIDLIGNKKTQSLYRDVVWNNSLIEIVVHSPKPPGTKEIISWWGWPDESPSWTWPGYVDSIMHVRVFTRCKTVQLDLNGATLATKQVPDSTPLTVTFDVPYQPGLLTVFAIKNGREVGVKTLITASEPAGIRLIADRKTIDLDDLAYINIEIIDAEGNVVPNADIPLQLEISGQGTLAGAGNACPNKPASFQQPACTTFKGKALAILRSNDKKGIIQLKVKANGLKPAEVIIKSQHL
jgi:beta-galactosidase